MKKVISIIVCFVLLVSCKNDDNNTVAPLFNCCNNEISKMINNKINDDIEIFNITTPNGDGTNDVFVIENIELFPDNTVTIYNSQNNNIFQVNSYGLNGEFFPNDSNIAEGTYRYKIEYVNAEDETIVKEGYLCVITQNHSNIDFSNCRVYSPNDILLQ